MKNLDQPAYLLQIHLNQAKNSIINKNNDENINYFKEGFDTTSGTFTWTSMFLLIL